MRSFYSISWIEFSNQNLSLVHPSSVVAQAVNQCHHPTCGGIDVDPATPRTERHIIIRTPPAERGWRGRSHHDSTTKGSSPQFNSTSSSNSFFQSTSLSNLLLTAATLASWWKNTNTWPKIKSITSWSTATFASHKPSPVKKPPLGPPQSGPVSATIQTTNPPGSATESICQTTNSSPSVPSPPSPGVVSASSSAAKTESTISAQSGPMD